MIVCCCAGDNKATAESVCRSIGIFTDTEELSRKSFIGRDFMALTPQQQLDALFWDNSGRVFSRYVLCVGMCLCVYEHMSVRV